MDHMMPRPILCILAGGRSSRFGAPKLWLRVNGVPMVTWIARQLAGVCGQRWLSVAPGMELPPGAGGCDRIVADHVGFGGPLAAMVRVLSQVDRRAWVLFAAGDMPLIQASHVRLMMRQLAAKRSVVGVMSQWIRGEQAGRIEPMPSLWRAGPALKLIRAAMERGVRGPSQLASWRSVASVPIIGEQGGRTFTNINRPEDVEALAAFYLAVRLGERRMGSPRKNAKGAK